MFLIPKVFRGLWYLALLQLSHVNENTEDILPVTTCSVFPAPYLNYRLVYFWIYKPYKAIESICSSAGFG